MLPNWKHDEFRDLLEMHLSGDALSPMDRDSLFDHVEECEECRKVLEAEERISERIKEIPKLVAPMDLRAKILKEAVKDYRERTTTIADDPVINPLIQGRREEDSQKSAAAGLNHSKIDLDFPVFDGVVTPRPGKLKLFWRRSSPVFATGFVTVAAFAALYTGSFDGIPGAAQLQAVVRYGVDQFRPDDENALPIAVALNERDLQEIRDISRLSMTKEAFPGDLIPGTEVFADRVKGAAEWFRRVENSFVAVARAAGNPIPEPAEVSSPQIAAIILKPTLKNDIGGFEESLIVSAVRETAGEKLGGIIEQQDQFAIDGRRYKTFIVEMSADSADSILKSLEEYRTDIDTAVVELLADEAGETAVNAQGSVACFSGDEQLLCEALAGLTPKEKAESFSKKKIRLIVME